MSTTSSTDYKSALASAIPAKLNPNQRLITLTGALTFGELGSIFPKAGGIYVFLKEAYGG